MFQQEIGSWGESYKVPTWLCKRCAEPISYEAVLAAARKLEL